MKERKPYPTDVTDEEWSFATPYLTLRRTWLRQWEDAIALRAIHLMTQAGGSKGTEVVNSV